MMVKGRGWAVGVKGAAGAVAACAFAFGGAAKAQIVNGDFEAGLTGWTTTGSVIAAPVGAPLHSTVGFISRAGMMWQTATLPPGTLTYSFQYAMLHLPNPGDSGPPLNDSFNAFILDAATLESVIPPAPGFEGLPTFLIGQQSGLAAVNAAFVTVVEPDLENEMLGTVTVNLAALPGPLPAQVRVEFGVLNGNDGSRLDLLIDNVAITVPGAGSGAEAMLVVAMAWLGRRRR